MGVANLIYSAGQGLKVHVTYILVTDVYGQVSLLYNMMFSCEINSVFKAIKLFLKGSYNKQNLTFVVI